MGDNWETMIQCFLFDSAHGVNHQGIACIPSAAMRHIEPEILETV